MKFIDISKHKFIEEPRYYFFGWSKNPKIIGRPSVIKALVQARKYLPKGYNFKIWDLQRTREVQIEMVKSFERRIKKEVFVYSAKPARVITRLDSHRLGGAIDLTIVDQNGVELYMGTDHDDLTAKAALDFYEQKMFLSRMDVQAKKNRRLLKKVMLSTGFEPYAPEWWHWGYSKP